LDRLLPAGAGARPLSPELGHPRDLRAVRAIRAVPPAEGNDRHPPPEGGRPPRRPVRGPPEALRRRRPPQSGRASATEPDSARTSGWTLPTPASGGGHTRPPA